MIKHILKQIWTQRAVNALLWGELFLVTIFIWYIVDYLFVTANTFYTPTGFNIEHTYKIRLDELPSESNEYISLNKDKASSSEAFMTAINRIRNYAGVEAVSLSHAAYPYDGSESDNNFLKDTASVNMQVRRVTPDFFRVFKVTTPQGDIEPLVSAIAQEKSIVISKDAETEFMGNNRSAIGKTLTSIAKDSTKYRVGGVTTFMRRSDFNKTYPSSIFLYAFLFCFLLNMLSAGIPAWKASRTNIVNALNDK
ncbi:ABC transporter permease [uncultured Bacteroides sp.]|uniref:ABC transporter permease n=1 Tax=uncultured Bacteroides sp. TaxID=162156 RepID=UPI002AAB7A4C|nr:ABC transporter permease [uncultured Bacteroides sp.]